MWRAAAATSDLAVEVERHAASVRLVGDVAGGLEHDGKAEAAGGGGGFGGRADDAVRDGETVGGEALLGGMLADEVGRGVRARALERRGRDAAFPRGADCAGGLQRRQGVVEAE
jgi:hypothetical protein